MNSDESVLDGDYAEREDEDAAMALCLNTIQRGHALCLRCRERWIGPCEQQTIVEPTVQKMTRPSDAEIAKHAELMERLNAIIAKRNRIVDRVIDPSLTRHGNSRVQYQSNRSEMCEQ